MTESTEDRPAEEGPSERNDLGGDHLYLGAILVVIALDWLIFRAFHTNYFIWYLDNGALISIVFGFVALAGADPNQRVDLISLSPRRYLVACFSLVIWPQLASAAALDSAGHDRSLINGVLLVPLSLCLLAAVWLFLLVAVPLQYFVYAVCGAPGRAVRRSAGHRSYWIAEGEGIKTEVLRAPRGEYPPELKDYKKLVETRANLAELEGSSTLEGDVETRATIADLRMSADEILKGMQASEVKFEDQPVKLTAAFASLVLWTVGQFVN